MKRFMSGPGFRLVLALLGGMLPVPAHAAPTAQMVSACQLGHDPTPEGSMPTHVDGVAIVSPREAKCVLDRFKDVVLIAPMRDLKQIPGAIPIVSLAAAPDNIDQQARAAPLVAKLTGSNFDRPVMVYCHHTSCQYSYNAALHLKQLGYRNILWLREGLKGWEKANYPLVEKLDDIHTPLDEPAYLMWAAALQDFACYSKETLDSCDMRLTLGFKGLNEPQVSGENRIYFVNDILWTSASRTQIYREMGQNSKSHESASETYAMLLKEAGNGAKAGMLVKHISVLRQYALRSLDLDKLDDLEALLAKMRADGSTTYREMRNAANGTPEHKALAYMVDNIGTLEWNIAAMTAGKADQLYKSGMNGDARRWRQLSDSAVDHAILWKRRYADTARMDGKDDELSTRVWLRSTARAARLRALLATAAGDQQSAAMAYEYVTSAACSIANPVAIQAVLNHEGGQHVGKRYDVDELYDAQTCVSGQAAYIAAKGAGAKWSSAQAKRDFDAYLSKLAD